MIHRHSDFNESTPLPKPRWGLHQIFPAYVCACLIAIAWAGIYFIA